ncbi:hypothetical protein [Streptomyces sp. NPDC091371]|uniref:hypothetical protein n=1 Tax=Streptomyces sp. NPDC091371 TaxID=3155303 RepID=UPI0034231D29
MTQVDLGADPEADPARRGWWASAPGAEVAVAVELVFLLAALVVSLNTTDDYGLPAWGPLSGFFLAVIVVLGVPAMLVTVLLHALLVTRPALALARRTGREWAAPAWLLAASAGCALVTARDGTSFPVAWACIAAIGLPPLLLARWALRTGRGYGAAVKALGKGAGLLALVALAGGAVLDGLGVVGYEPPRLSRAAYIGDWHGEEGGTVRIREGGTVEVEGVSVDVDGGAGERRCTGAGTWRYRPAGSRTRAGVQLEVPGCPGWEQSWEVAGSVRRPELFHIVGDPDSGVLRILSREGAS